MNHLSNIINLTLHAATPSQVQDGVVNLPTDLRDHLEKQQVVTDLPSETDIRDRCTRISVIATVGWERLQLSGCPTAMIGGPPWLMFPLTMELLLMGVRSVAAFSQRTSTERLLPDGSVRKEQRFEHLGFVPMRVPDADLRCVCHRGNIRDTMRSILVP